MSARSGSSRHSTTRPRTLTWVYQAAPSRTVSEALPSRCIQATRARSASMLTSTRPSSSTRYQVATDMGWPSGISTAITAGFARRSSSSAAGGNGGLGTGLLRVATCQDPGMQLREVIRRRRMVRAYQADRPVPTDVVTRLLEHAVHAPSAGFSQGWDFVVLREAADRDLFWAVTSEDDEEPDAWLRGLQTAALLMLLTAVDEGLGACFFGVPPHLHDAVRAAFAVPNGRRPVGVVSVGYPAPDRRSPSLRRGRRSVAQVAHDGRFGVPWTAAG